MAVPGAVGDDEIVASGSSNFATCSTGRTTNDDAIVVTAGELEVVVGSMACGSEPTEEEQLANARVLRSRPLTKVRESLMLQTVRAGQLVSRSTTASTNTGLD